ncbi:MAG TPA: dTDP-4-dehydrorhamnose 3,5-epimerase [Methylomirabilota bacterium]|jgi:dTDP-4-dehydrorhamnose 3,5-epimerase
MIFTPALLPGAFIVEPDLHRDVRGFFARTWCQEEFTAHGLNPRLVQCSVSFTERRGTVRGLHYQDAPHQEAKLVRCVRGAIHDVIVDLRRQSPTFRRHVAVELREGSYRMLYVPEGVAHGFQTLADGTEVAYQMSEFHRPEAARGVRWDDPAFAIPWPESVRVVSDRDRSFPDFAE